MRTRNSVALAPLETGNKTSRRNSSFKSPFLLVPKIGAKNLKKRDSTVMPFQKDPSLTEFASSSSLLFYDKDRQQQSSNPSMFGQSRYVASMVMEEERLLLWQNQLRVKVKRAFRKLVLILGTPLVKDYIATKRISEQSKKVIEYQ